MFIIPLIVFVVGFFLYLNIEKSYFRHKKDIMRIFSSFLSDIRVDKIDKKMDLSNLEDTKNNIIYFSERLIKLEKLYYYNKKFTIGFDTKNEEKKYIIEIVDLFKKGLDDWLYFNHKELETVSEHLNSKIKVENKKDFESVLKLQKKRINYYKSKISL